MTKLAYPTGLAAMFSLSACVTRSPEADFGNGMVGNFNTPFDKVLPGTPSGAKASEAITMGLTGKTIAVHKKDAEGILLIDAFTGQVLPDSLQGEGGRPEWATYSGLVMAMLTERLLWHSSRLGGTMSPEQAQPEVLAFEDVTWLALNTEDGEETVIEADDEFRMEILSAALGINRETGDITGTLLADIEVASDNTRSAAELAMLEEAQQERFQKTGTGE